MGLTFPLIQYITPAYLNENGDAVELKGGIWGEHNDGNLIIFFTGGSFWIRNTVLYWTLSGLGVTQDDLTYPPKSSSENPWSIEEFNLTGSGIASSGTPPYTSGLYTFAKDQLVEGDELLEIKLFSDRDRSQQIGSTYQLIIADGLITGVSDEDENINGTNSHDKIRGGSGDDVIDGKAGIDTAIYTSNFSEYSFTRSTTSIQIQFEGHRFGMHDGTDTLKNIEYIQFSDQTVEESKVDVAKTYSGNFSDYKFYNKGNGNYQIKTDSGYDDITGLPLLTFTGEATTSSFREVSAITDIEETFDQVTGLNTDDANMFRLYNASFKRLLDPDGLKYWIGKYSSGENDDRAVASSFLVSAEFKERYGDSVSDATYVNNLYKNVLGRDADTSGLNYWLGQLSSGAETRYEVLLGFSESAENKTLFTEMTGFG